MWHVGEAGEAARGSSPALEHDALKDDDEWMKATQNLVSVKLAG